MASALHKKAKALLHKLYPTCTIQEEIPIKIGGRTLYIDLYIGLLKLAVEVGGQQHYSYSSLFHKDKLDFLRQQKRDREKAEYLDEHGIKLIVLKYDEQDQWESQLK